MTKEIHQGVGLLIGNQDQSRFFVQIKDEQYPFEAWRGACAFWGGAIEKEDANALVAVEREVMEEIPAAVPILRNISKTKIKQYLINNQHVQQVFGLTIFEAIVSDEQLEKIAQSEVLEGKGVLMNRATLLQAQWIWGIDFIFEEYLKLKDNL
ncbi:NUDIX domain-containing protein [Aureispira anguillae]|uniref:NUDIX domain-containing protein n=1 Tax=Aureispira anguillae TaxID=2864201 RepID=A0A915YFN1_9BACT|nr:NUDIX domain-containing protein [Aureispira anguillae]BDS12272.1 NUDIX domain-containing protein [Aureispira anguillae]